MMLWSILAPLMGGHEVKAQDPDSRGEYVILNPSLSGRSVNAPIPNEIHVRNEGGSDGAGLCVISSVLANGMSQGVPGLNIAGRDERSGQLVAGKGSTLWRTAKARPGGYGPEKLAELVEEVMPGEKYASFVGRDTSILETLSSRGYRVGVTMNTGKQYNYMPIHHMVSLEHYSAANNVAMVADNNDPGKHHVMPATEFNRRWIDGGDGWAWVWTRKPMSADSLAAIIIIGASLFAMLLRNHQIQGVSHV